MGQFKKGNTIGKEYRFTSKNQPAKRGRKPSLYKKIRAITGKTVKYEMGKEDYYDIIKYLMEQTPEQLRKLSGIGNDSSGGKSTMFDAEIPVWMMNIITAILSDVRYGRTSTLDGLLDRIFGKATQPIDGDLTSNVTTHTSDDLSALSTDELLMYNQLLDKIRNAKKE